jgi:hypothetical protein
MMAFGLSEFTDLLHKGPCLAKVAEPEGPLDTMSVVAELRGVFPEVTASYGTFQIVFGFYSATPAATNLLMSTIARLSALSPHWSLPIPNSSCSLGQFAVGSMPLAKLRSS